MSLLADLLSKIKQPQTKREIPPNLKNIVQASATRSAKKKKIVLFSALFAFSVLAGLYLARSLTEISSSNPVVRTPEPAVQADKKINKFGEEQKSKAVVSNKVEDVKSAITPPASAVKPKSGDSHPAKDKLVQKETVKAKVAVKSEKKDLPQVAGKQSPIKKEEVAQDKALSLTRQEDTSRKDSYLYEAREYEKKNDYYSALAAYKKALEMDKQDYSVLNNIAYIYLQLGNPEESVRHAEMALEVNNDYIPALINLGIANARLQNNSAAEQYFNRAIDLEPDNQTVILNLAILHERQKDYIKASEYYTQLVRYGNVEGSLGMARMYEKQGRTEDAIRLYRNIYDLDSIDDKTRTHVRQRIIMLMNKKGR